MFNNAPTTGNLQQDQASRSSLSEFRRRLAMAAPQTVNFAEINDYDKKMNRIRLPDSFFAAFEGFSLTVRVALGFGGQIVLLPSEAWDAYLEEMRESLEQIRCGFFLEEFCRTSHSVPIDAKHRITLGTLLVEEADLRGEALWLPGRQIEIWNPAIHANYRKKLVFAINAKLGFPTESQLRTPPR